MNGFIKGDRVAFQDRNGQAIQGIYDHHCPNGKAYLKSDGGMAYERTYGKFTKIAGAKTNFQVTSNGNQEQKKEDEHSDINERFEYLQQLVRMILNGTAVSLIITGIGGAGKTYTVKGELLRRNLHKDQDFKYIKGFSTARGLYRTLFENKDKMLIFDDCDEILVDPSARNILKGVLDSYDEREVCWITKTSDESLPDSFIFEGRAIFISNKSQDSIDQAILSRSMCIDLTMSKIDMLKRMHFIVENSKDFMPSVLMEHKQEAFKIIEENLDNIKELSLRSLEKVIKVRIGQEDNYEYDDKEELIVTDWKILAKYMLIN